MVLRKGQGIVNNHLISHTKIHLCIFSHHMSNETIELYQWNKVLTFTLYCSNGFSILSMPFKMSISI